MADKNKTEEKRKALPGRSKQQKLDPDGLPDFHDSFLEELFDDGKNVQFQILIDTYWYPGGQYGVLDLLDCEYDPKLQDSLKQPGIDCLEHSLVDGKHVFKLDLIDVPGKTWTLTCKSFKFFRTDSLKDIEEIDKQNKIRAEQNKKKRL